MVSLKGRIVEINKYPSGVTFVKQGVKKHDQHKYERYAGGNGTYVIGGEYGGMMLDVKVFVYDIEKCRTFEVYDDILQMSGMKRISSKLYDKILTHEGDKIKLYYENGTYHFDPSILLN